MMKKQQEQQIPEPQQQPLIFTEQRLLPRLVDIVLTLIAWAGFLWLIYTGVVETLIKRPEMGPRPVASTFNTLTLYLVIAVFYGATLIIWAKYNQFRFRTERRSRKPGLERDDVAESFRVSPELVTELSQARVSVAHHDEHGGLIGVDIKDEFGKVQEQ